MMPSLSRCVHSVDFYLGCTIFLHSQCRVNVHCMEAVLVMCRHFTVCGCFKLYSVPFSLCVWLLQVVSLLLRHVYAVLWVTGNSSVNLFPNLCYHSCVSIVCFRCQELWFYYYKDAIFNI